MTAEDLEFLFIGFVTGSSSQRALRPRRLDSFLHLRIAGDGLLVKANAEESTAEHAEGAEFFSGFAPGSSSQRALRPQRLGYILCFSNTDDDLLVGTEAEELTAERAEGAEFFSGSVSASFPQRALRPQRLDSFLCLSNAGDNLLVENTKAEELTAEHAEGAEFFSGFAPGSFSQRALSPRRLDSFICFSNTGDDLLMGANAEELTAERAEGAEFFSGFVTGSSPQRPQRPQRLNPHFPQP